MHGFSRSASEIMDKVLEAESEARNILKTAGQEADRLRAEARLKARELTDRIQQQTRLEEGQITESGLRAAEQEQQSRLTLAGGAIAKEIHLEADSRGKAVASVLEIITRS